MPKSVNNCPMKKIISTLICATAAFVLSLGWIRRITKQNDVSLFCASIIAVCFAVLIYYATIQSQNNKRKADKAIKQTAQFVTALEFGTNNADYFAEIFRYFGYKTKTVDFDNLIIEKNQEKSFVHLCYLPSVPKNNLIGAVVAAKRNDCKKLYVFGQAASFEDVKTCDGQLPTTFIGCDEAYYLAKTSDKLILSEVKQKKPKIIARYAFNKKRFGWYLTGALYLGATSLLSFMPIYTLIWATALFGVSLFCLFNKRFNVAKTGAFPVD